MGIIESIEHSLMVNIHELGASCSILETERLRSLVRTQFSKHLTWTSQSMRDFQEIFNYEEKEIINFKDVKLKYTQSQSKHYKHWILLLVFVLFLFSGRALHVLHIQVLLIEEIGHYWKHRTLVHGQHTWTGISLFIIWSKQREEGV